MADEQKDNRPWYKKKTNWGLVIYATGEGMTLCGTICPILVPMAPIVKTLGGILAGFGIADRAGKK